MVLTKKQNRYCNDISNVPKIFQNAELKGTNSIVLTILMKSSYLIGSFLRNLRDTDIRSRNNGSRRSVQRSFVTFENLVGFF